VWIELDGREETSLTLPANVNVDGVIKAAYDAYDLTYCDAKAYFDGVKLGRRQPAPDTRYRAIEIKSVEAVLQPTPGMYVQ